jgi:hypothetical protein
LFVVVERRKKKDISIMDVKLIVVEVGNREGE